jgi:hypothetical protein
MSPKEFFVDKIAAWFANHGLNVLLYDARTLGASDGLPRCDLDPQKMAEDNSDAVTVCIDQNFVHKITRRSIH